MASKVAVKRLNKEYRLMRQNPPPYIVAKPLESNILEWHYVLRGPQETPYEGGEYHGRLKFPQDYPYKPPAIQMITPNGRFDVNTNICTTMSNFHPNLWNPAWSVSTILTGLLSFMVEDEMTAGGIRTTEKTRQNLSRKSHAFNLANPTFKNVFPELCFPVPAPLPEFTPKKESSSDKNSDNNGDDEDNSNSRSRQVRMRPSLMKHQKEGENDTKTTQANNDTSPNIRQRNVTHKQLLPSYSTNSPLTDDDTVAANKDSSSNNVNEQQIGLNPSPSASQKQLQVATTKDQQQQNRTTWWMLNINFGKKWLLFLGIFLYLVVSKLIDRVYYSQ